MPVNITEQFKVACQQQHQSAGNEEGSRDLADGLRQRGKASKAVSTVHADDSPTSVAAATTGRKPLESMDAFMAEAYRIVDHLASLEQFLARVKSSYLAKLSSGMSESERDSVDKEAKEILNGCTARVRQLEASVKAEAPSTGTVMMRQLLHTLSAGGPLEQDQAWQEAIEQQQRAHRGAVIWWLNRRLVTISTQQREQQETRLRRTIERQRSSLRATGDKALTAEQASAKWASADLDEQKMVESTLQLSPEQQQQLESENETLASGLSNTLDQVKAAEKAILEIAELQNQLMMHVAIQAKETERLYAEAVASTDRVREGNQQLAEAGRRSADTRKWVLFFLIMTSLILLFLDWYD